MKNVGGKFLDEITSLHTDMTDVIRCYEGEGLDWTLEFKSFCAELKSTIKQEENRMMLYPDMTRDTFEGSDHFCFAAPCTEDEWMRLFKYAHKERNNNHYAPYTFIDTEDEPPEEVCIILIDPGIRTNDDAITTAAWIRVSEEFTGMIYALQFDSAYGSNQSLSQIICRTADVNPAQVRHVTINRRDKA